MLKAYWIPAAICFFGAAFQELLYWYQIRAKLSQDEYRQMIGSTKYWVVTALMIFATPLGVLIWFSDTLESLKPRDFFLFGASFPLIVKTGIGAVIAQQEQRVTLGERPVKSPLKSYFGF